MADQAYRGARICELPRANRTYQAGRTCAAELVAEFGVRAVALPIDVGVRDHVVAAVERTVTEFGSVDIVVNNAWGGGTTSRLEDKNDLAFEHGWRVGLMSAVWSMGA